MLLTPVDGLLVREGVLSALSDMTRADNDSDVCPYYYYSSLRMAEYDLHRRVRLDCLKLSRAENGLTVRCD